MYVWIILKLLIKLVFKVNIYNVYIYVCIFIMYVYLLCMYIYVYIYIFSIIKIGII